MKNEKKPVSKLGQAAVGGVESIKGSWKDRWCYAAPFPINLIFKRQFHLLKDKNIEFKFHQMRLITISRQIYSSVSIQACNTNRHLVKY